MATATVSGLNLHELTDYATVRELPMAQISRSSVSPTRVERMITGRLIAVTAPGVLARWGVRLTFATRADVEWLRSREGDTFYARTAHGETFFATVNGVTATEALLPGTPSDSVVGGVTFQLSEVTLTVEV